MISVALVILAEALLLALPANGGSGSGGHLRKLYEREKTLDDLQNIEQEFEFMSVCSAPGVEKSANGVSGGYHESQKLYGREKTLDDLQNAVQKFLFVSVCGAPGVGKSALVQNGAKIFQNHNYTVLHIDMLDSSTNMSNLIRFLYTSFDQVESAANERKSNDQRIEQWLKIVASFEPAILILDNLDCEWTVHDTLHDLLIQPLLKLNIASKLKVVATSLCCFEQKDLHHKKIPLWGIDDGSCADWISTNYINISYSNSKQLCYILDGIPLAVKIVAAFITDPSRSYAYTAENVIQKLNSSEFGNFFKYLVESKIISEGTSLFNSLFLVYNNTLEIKHRHCIFQLSIIASMSHYRLSHEDIMSYFQSEDEDFTNECIEKLLMLSLMEKVPHSGQHLYQFNKSVMKFIQWLEEPKVNDTFKQMARRVWGNVIQQFINERRIILNEKRSIQLATEIGSNKRLVNSLLPLFGKNYVLMPLFEHALNIIKEQFCQKGIWYTASDLIFAYSYLTRVVYCPEYHPTALLMNVSDDQATVASSNLCSDTCFRKLMYCSEKLELLYKSVPNDIKVAEAFAHYSAFLMLARCNHSDMETKWKPFLFDLAMIITTANSECERYCNRIRTCSCGSQSHIELGLSKFLTNERNLSKHHLQEALVPQTTHESAHEYQHCRTILKTLAIMTIHIQSGSGGHVDSGKYFQRIDINYSQVDPTCFLGVLEDIILPFLRKVHPKQDSIKTLEEKHGELMDKKSSQNGNCDAYSSIRYARYSGLTALKLPQLQEELGWPNKIEWRPREGWVCSIIKDKTRKCQLQDSIRLPLFDQVKSKETELNDKIFFSLKYLMDEEEFAKWDEKVQKIPWFYQLMSI